MIAKTRHMCASCEQMRLVAARWPGQESRLLVGCAAGKLGTHELRELPELTATDECLAAGSFRLAFGKETA